MLRTSTSIHTCLLVLLHVFAWNASAQESPSIDQATVDVTSSSVSFEASQPVDYLYLTVKGPDSAISRDRTEDGSALSFGLFDEDGEYRTDGPYRYELRGLPTGEERELILASGTVTIANGAFVSPDQIESVDKDQVIADELNVQNSLCVGTDCDFNENFGFWTVKLKENNLRILFDDTSDSTSSFPSRDWALEANESENGGAEHFSIQDCGSGCTNVLTVQGGAPENAFYLDKDGDVGIGTSVPSLDLNILRGDSPGLRLSQDGSSGFSPQSWDIVGNETFFYIRDVTHGSELPFIIETRAPRNSIYIESDGDVGLGTNAPGERLDVVGSIALSGTVDGRDVAADGAALDAHVADTANPHGVTAAQIGAESAGSAVAAIVAHESAYDHSLLASLSAGQSIPVAQGGTGASDAAAARANLGIEDDPTRTGILLPGSFSGDPAAGVPATATVVFEEAYAPGTTYAVLLTAMSSDASTPVTPFLTAKSESGFTVAVPASASGALVELDWMARPAEVTPEPDGITCTLGTENVWADGFVLDDITVTNNGSQTVTSWAVVLVFAEPTTIVNSWNAQLTQLPDGTIGATGDAGNGTLAPGASTTFGFQGTHDGSFILPTCSGS